MRRVGRSDGLNLSPASQWHKHWLLDDEHLASQVWANCACIDVTGGLGEPILLPCVHLRYVSLLEYLHIERRDAATG